MDGQAFIKIHGNQFETSESEARAFRRLQRRIRYLETNIKQEQFDPQRAKFVPSKEDSLDRLLAAGNEFEMDQPSVEDRAIANILVDKLTESLKQLTSEERALIFALYFQVKSERQISAETGIPQKTINYKKHYILCKLLKLLKE